MAGLTRVLDLAKREAFRSEMLVDFLIAQTCFVQRDDLQAFVARKVPHCCATNVGGFKFGEAPKSLRR